MSGVLNAVVGGGGAVTPTDAYFNRTTLLLHGNGTNGAQNNTFLDSSTNNTTITRNGNTTQGTFSPFSQADGYWSNYMVTGGVTAAANANFALSGDFTIECWVFAGDYSLDGSTRRRIYCTAGGEVANNLQLLLGTSGGNSAVISVLNSGWLIDGTINVVTGSWNHVAVTRSGTSLRLFVNGVQSGSTATTSQNFNSGTSNTIYVGQYSSGGIWQGYISNFRILNGTAAYTSSFTPPTTPLTTITNTLLLTCQSNRFKDNSTNAFTTTPTGTPSVQAFSPFAPTAAYSAIANGGSAYFDGSGDYLSAGSNAAFAFGTGAYTVEMWIYPFSISQQAYLFNDATGGSGFYFETTSSAGFTIAPRGTGTPSPTGGYSSLKVNQWHHVVFCRASTSTNQASIFVNGARVVNGTESNNWTVTGPCIVGGLTANSYMFNGYISDVRIVKGTDVYGYTNTSITVPTSPLTSITNTSLLLSNTNSGIIDNAAKNDLETVGNAQISTTQSKFGSASMYFDGSGSYASFVNNPINVLGDFTIEGWFYSAAATSSFMGLFGFGALSSSISPVTLVLGNATSGANPASSVCLLASVDGSNWAILSASSSGTTSNSAWYHFAVVRSGGTFTVYLNGTAVITSTAISATTSLYSGGTLNRVGAYGYSGYYYSGYIDDFRVTKGYARYTSNFTVPSAPYPDK